MFDIPYLTELPLNYKRRFRERTNKFIEKFAKNPKGTLCRPFYKLTFAWGCPFGCSYCYLKGTFRKKGWNGQEITLYTNLAEMQSEVVKFLIDPEIPKSVLHTGELTDSLADPYSEIALAPVIHLFSLQDRHKLLLLTKSDRVDWLLNLYHNKKTVVGFSLNPPEIIEKYENLTARYKDRLRAARKCKKSGYPLLLRIDPIIPVGGWEDLYSELIDDVNSLEPEAVAIGTLRAYSILKTQKDFPKELNEKLIEYDRPSGRWRIPLDKRKKMYDFMMSKLSAKNVGICKERGELFSELAVKHNKKFACNCSLDFTT